jgi:chromosome segregation ATPase
MDARAIAELEALQARDDELAGRRERLRELAADVAAIRGRAEAIDTFFSAYPAEDERLRANLAEARADLEHREAERAEARRALEHARDDEARELARRAITRADDHVAVATARLEAAEAARAELERAAAALPGELPELEERAAAIAAGADGVPEARSGPRELVEWASHAQAELFVSAGQVDAQRDRVVREANELASMLLGEPTYGSTVAQALRRVAANADV